MSIELSKTQKIDGYLGGVLLLAVIPLARLARRLLRRRHDLTNPRHILVLKPLGAGSLVIAMPALMGIRNRFPEATITLVCTREVAPMADMFPVFDAVRTVDTDNWGRLVVTAMGTLLWSIRRADTVIDLEVHSKLTTVFTTITFAQNRIGFIDLSSHWRAKLYTHTLYFNDHSGVYAYYDGIAALFGATPVGADALAARLSESVAAHDPGLDLPADYLAVGAGCSQLGRERQLDPDAWHRVLAGIRAVRPGTTFVLLGGPGDRPLCAAIAEGEEGVVDLAGRLPLLQSVKVLSEARGFVGIDSLLLHLAWLLCDRVQSFWGPTDPATRMRPRAAAHQVLYAHCSCSPCVHVMERPPCEGNNVCMQTLDLDRAAGFWAKEGAGSPTGGGREPGGRQRAGDRLERENVVLWVSESKAPGFHRLAPLPPDAPAPAGAQAVGRSSAESSAD